MNHLFTSAASASRREGLAARAAAGAGTAALALAVLAGCAAGAPADTAAPTADAAGAGATATAESTAGAASTTGTVVETGIDGLTVVDPWIKATDRKMTGLFGVFRNDTGADLEIASIEAPIAGMTEQHETVVGQDGSSVMQPIEGGFTIPAGGELVLKPGDDHIMLMQLTGAIMPGDEIPVTITFADGQTASLTVIAKEYTGAQESYAPGHGGAGGSSSPAASGEPTATP